MVFSHFPGGTLTSLGPTPILYPVHHTRVAAYHMRSTEECHPHLRAFGRRLARLQKSFTEDFEAYIAQVN